MVRSIVEALAEYAKVQPDKLFLADGKVELTYLDAWKCVYGYAVHLRELGIRRGDHVVVRNSQNAQLVISQLAIQLVGAVFVPIEKNAADDRIAEIIGAVEAKLYLAAKQGEFSCKWETIKDVLSYKMDDAAEMRISESDDENGDSFRFPEPEETAEVLFTTGTTGKSKGIELTYESVIAVSEKCDWFRRNEKRQCRTDPGTPEPFARTSPLLFQYFKWRQRGDHRRRDLYKEIFRSDRKISCDSDRPCTGSTGGTVQVKRRQTR